MTHTPTKNSETLLPCPFCGSDARTDAGMGHARCSKAACELGKPGYAPWFTIDDWNTRAPERGEGQETGREWIRCVDRMPEMGTPIWIRWGDMEYTPDTSSLRRKRVMNQRMKDLMDDGAVAWWTERLIDEMPPFPTYPNTEDTNE